MVLKMSKELEVITSVEDVPQSSIKEFENSRGDE